MESLLAGLAILAVFVLGQVPAVVYLSRHFGADDRDPEPLPEGWTEVDPEASHREPVSAGAVRCWSCGAVNDEAFDYCSTCLGPLRDRAR